MIIDWEMAGPGDPAWDIASVWGEFLRFWVFHDLRRPASDRRPGPWSASSGPVPALSGARPFWLGYVGSARSKNRGEQLLHRAAALSGVWLLGRLFERAQQMEEMDRATATALQLCANVIDRPAAAATVLFRCQATP